MNCDHEWVDITTWSDVVDGGKRVYICVKCGRERAEVIVNKNKKDGLSLL